MDGGDYMKKRRMIQALFVGTLLLSGCSSSTPTQKENTNYTYTLKNGRGNGQFMGPFDTVFQVIMYEKNEKKFQEQMAYIEQRFTYYHQLFDKYNNYPGMSNVKTINDQAGSYVEVDSDLYQLIKQSIEDYNHLSTSVDISLGPVLDVWHVYRERDNGDIPTDEELKNAGQYVGVDHIHLDDDKQAVMVDVNSSIDVGATAKGYACELVKKDLIERGLDDFLISAGGNVVTYGKRETLAGESELSKFLPDCREYYTIDILNPFNATKGFCAIVLNGDSAVTSGDYQRYYVGKDGVSYHHLIDPATLKPARYFRSVTIVTKDSGLADFMSSALFLTPLSQGQAMVEAMDGLEAVWVDYDGNVFMSSGLKEGVNIHVYN